jgi:hypothetical protein
MKNSPPQRRTKARRKPKRFNGQRPILLNATLTNSSSRQNKAGGGGENDGRQLLDGEEM